MLEKPLDFMHCVASRFGYPNCRLSELSLVPISSDNRRSTVYGGRKEAKGQVDKHSNQGCKKSARNGRIERTDIRPENMGKKN